MLSEPGAITGLEWACAVSVRLYPVYCATGRENEAKGMKNSSSYSVPCYNHKIETTYVYLFSGVVSIFLIVPKCPTYRPFRVG